MKKLEDYLFLHASQRAGATAVVCGEESWTYAELAARVERQTAVYAQTLSRQPYVLLRAVPTPDFLVSYWAAHRAGKIAVPLEKDLPPYRFDEISSRLSSCTFPEGTADILFTTGTVGQSKGVMVSHGALLADAENLIDAMGYTSGLNFLLCGPLNHLGTLSKVFPTLLVGGTLHLMDGLKDIAGFFDRVEQTPGRFATFLVPAHLRMLLRLYRERLQALSSRFGFIETGAAPLSEAEIRDFYEVFPQTPLFNTYASTETGIISTCPVPRDAACAACVGKPMLHSGFFITPEGHIACTGKTLMTGYVGDAGRTRRVLRQGVVYTSDLGHLDPAGQLILEGRADDVINVGGYKVSPAEVESCALQRPDIQECICVPARHPVIGIVLKLLVVLPAGVAVLDKKALAGFLKTRLETYKVPFYYEQVDHIERTFNGKINRKFYGQTPAGHRMS